MSVFISHSRLDQIFVDRLCRCLVEKNVKIWRDSWHISPGDSLSGRIAAAIGQASVFCVVVSANSKSSKWVSLEIREALRQAGERVITILPLIVDECEPPEEISDLLHIDFRSDFDHALRRMLELVTRSYDKRAAGTIERCSGYPYPLDWAREVGERDGKFFMQLDTVSIDAEANHSVLAQFVFESHDSEFRGRLELDETEDVGAVLIGSCAESFRENPAWIKLKSGEIKRIQFTLHCEDQLPMFEVSVRVRRLGKQSHTIQLFNLGGIIVQIDDTIRDVNDGLGHGKPRGLDS